MRISIELEVAEFTVPNFVNSITKSSIKQGSYPAIPISDLDQKTLDQLCRNFRAEVFKKAGRPDPEIFPGTGK